MAYKTEPSISMDRGKNLAATTTGAFKSTGVKCCQPSGGGEGGNPHCSPLHCTKQFIAIITLHFQVCNHKTKVGLDCSNELLGAVGRTAENITTSYPLWMARATPGTEKRPSVTVAVQSLSGCRYQLPAPAHKDLWTTFT